MLRLRVALAAETPLAFPTSVKVAHVESTARAIAVLALIVRTAYLREREPTLIANVFFAFCTCLRDYTSMRCV